MKRTMMLTAVAGIFMLCFVSTARAQGFADLPEEGKQVIAAAKFMLSQSQKIAAAKDVDRASMVDIGHQLIKHGYDYMESGEMMYTDEGRANMQEMGRDLLASGQSLLKMGRQKGALTQKEKDELKKQSDFLNGIGKLMLDKGQIMTG
jgi:hypothetical protein